MRNNIRSHIEKACKARLSRMSYLPGGSVGEVWKLEFENGLQAVAKTANHGDTLDIEGYMLSYLKQHSNLPVPEVILSQPDLLVIEWIENEGGPNSIGDETAADYLLALHEKTAPRFGLERDTLIGSLHQPNPQSDDWVSFFRDHRLLYMGRVALERDRLTASVMDKIEHLSSKLDQYITNPKQPSLLHGDIWSGNVLYQDQKVAAFIDPAIYYGHREVELAYTTLFHTFGDRFFPRYNETYQLDKDFFETRLPIYHLYPLLVHCALFGGSYIQASEEILDRFI